MSKNYEQKSYKKKDFFKFLLILPVMNISPDLPGKSGSIFKDLTQKLLGESQDDSNSPSRKLGCFFKVILFILFIIILALVYYLFFVE